MNSKAGIKRFEPCERADGSLYEGEGSAEVWRSLGSLKDAFFKARFSRIR